MSKSEARPVRQKPSRRLLTASLGVIASISTFFTIESWMSVKSGIGAPLLSTATTALIALAALLSHYDRPRVAVYGVSILAMLPAAGINYLESLPLRGHLILGLAAIFGIIFILIMRYRTR